MRTLISDNIAVISGVPQGDHLLSLLFLLFINNISNRFKHSNFLLLVDDLKIFNTIRCQNDILLYLTTIKMHLKNSAMKTVCL